MSVRPKQYDIDGDVTTITYVPKIDGGSAEGYPTSGDARREGLIRVRTKQTRWDERATLLHEIMHDCLMRAGIRTFATLKTEELFITLLEPYLLSVLRDNPELRDYLFEEGAR